MTKVSRVSIITFAPNFASSRFGARRVAVRISGSNWSRSPYGTRSKDPFDELLKRNGCPQPKDRGVSGMNTGAGL